MTDKNTLNTWFTTGSKPTQEQFWAWQDSYWHKGDSIPQSSVDGLEKALSLKAEAQAVNGLAKKDATNLQATDVDAWKTKLGVGNLPPNIATYDPAKVNYVMMKDGTDRPAGDLGKNVANASLTSVRGAGLTLGDNWSLSTRGYSYYIEGLPDKSNDSTYNKMLVQDSTGKVAMSDGMPLLRRQGAVLPDVSNDGSYSRILVSNPNGDTGLGDATNIVAALQSATQVEINTFFNLLGGGYQGMSSPVVNSIFPPAVPYIDGSTQEITLYGAGLNILNDPITASVKIIDVGANSAYAVGYNSVSGNVLKIYVPWNIISVGKEYKVQITNGVLNYQTILSFQVADPNRFQEIILNDSNWQHTEIVAGSVAANGKYTLQNNIFTAPSKPASAIVDNYLIGAFTYDLSQQISPTDNFSIEIEALNGYIFYNNSDGLKVGFKDVSTPHTSDRYSGFIYGYANFDGPVILNPRMDVFGNGSNVVTKIVITRQNSRVTTTLVNIQGSTLYSISGSIIPAPGIQNLQLVFAYKLFRWDSQLKIKKLIKW